MLVLDGRCAAIRIARRCIVWSCSNWMHRSSLNKYIVRTHTQHKLECNSVQVEKVLCFSFATLARTMCEDKEARTETTLGLFSRSQKGTKCPTDDSCLSHVLMCHVSCGNLESYRYVEDCRIGSHVTHPTSFSLDSQRITVQPILDKINQQNFPENPTSIQPLT